MVDNVIIAPIQFERVCVGMKVATKISLSLKEKQQLKKNVRSMTTPIRLAERSKIVVLAADGFTNQEIERRQMTS